MVLYVALPFLVAGSFEAHTLGHILALPVMLWAIWGTRLHGTARSVRLIAFLGMAFVLGDFWVRTRLLSVGEKGADMQPSHGLLGLQDYGLALGVIFMLLAVGTLFSIHKAGRAK